MAATSAMRAGLEMDVVREVPRPAAGWAGLDWGYVCGLAEQLRHVGLMLMMPPAGESFYMVCPEDTVLSGHVTLVKRNLQLDVDRRPVVVEYWIPEAVLEETVRRMATLTSS
jgi:hypothetical protein